MPNTPEPLPEYQPDGWQPGDPIPSDWMPAYRVFARLAACGYGSDAQTITPHQSA